MIIMSDLNIDFEYDTEVKLEGEIYYIEGINVKVRFESGKIIYIINTPYGYIEFPYIIDIPDHYTVFKENNKTIIEQRTDGKYQFKYTLDGPTKIKMHLIVNNRPSKNQYIFPLQLPEGYYFTVNDIGLNICLNYEPFGEIILATFPHQVGISNQGKIIHVNYSLEDNIPYINYIDSELNNLTENDYPLDIDPSLIVNVSNPSFWFGWIRTVYVFPSGKTFVLLVDNNNILRTYWCYHNQNWQTGPTISNVAHSYGVYGFGVKDNEDVLLFYRKNDNKAYCRACFWTNNNYILGNESKISNANGHPTDAIFDKVNNYWVIGWQIANSPYTTYIVKTPHGQNLSFSPCGISPYGSDTNGTKVGLNGSPKLCIINNILYAICSNSTNGRIFYNRMINNNWTSAIDTNVNTKGGNILGSIFPFQDKIIHGFWKTNNILNFFQIDINHNTYTKLYNDISIEQPNWEQGPAICYIGDSYFVPIELSVNNLHKLYKLTNGNLELYNSINRIYSNTGGAICCVDKLPLNFGWHGYTTSTGYYLYEFTYEYIKPEIKIWKDMSETITNLIGNTLVSFRDTISIYDSQLYELMIGKYCINSLMTLFKKIRIR